MNPFESDIEKSEFFLDDQNEEKSLAKIRQRIADANAPAPKSVFFSNKIFFIAASLALIVAISFFLLRSDTPVDMEQLANEYFQHYPNFQNLNLRGHDYLVNLEAAYEAYDQGRYQSATEIFNAHKSTLDDVDNFYYSISLIGIHDYKKASAVLSNLQSLESGEYKFAYSFYNGLAILAQGDSGQAIAIFEKLANGDSQFSSRASSILEMISSRD